MGDNIVLIGFMGSGKTSIGIKLSYRLRRTVLDVDKQIERKENLTISEIFKMKGEKYFRKLETQCLEELVHTCRGQIISAGGGTPLKAENRELLRQLGKVIYLKITPETCYERVKDDKGRPLLLVEDPLATIRGMLQERNPVYEEAADVILETEGKEFEEILDIIVHETGME